MMLPRLSATASSTLRGTGGPLGERSSSASSEASLGQIDAHRNKLSADAVVRRDFGIAFPLPKKLHQTDVRKYGGCSNPVCFLLLALSVGPDRQARGRVRGKGR